MKILIASLFVLVATHARADNLIVSDLNISQQGLSTTIYATLSDGSNQGITFSIAGDSSTDSAISDGLKKSLQDTNKIFGPNAYLYQMETAGHSNTVIKIKMIQNPAKK
jgi:hypothetical protein